MRIQESNLLICWFQKEMRMFRGASQRSKEVLIIHQAINSRQIDLLWFLQSDSYQDYYQQFLVFMRDLV